MAADNYIHTRAARELLVVAECLVRERHDHLGPGGVDFGNDAGGGGAGILKLDIRPWTGSLQRFLQHDAEDANLHAFEFAHDELWRVGKCLPGLPVDYVGGQPLEMRLAHSFTQNI